MSSRFRFTLLRCARLMSDEINTVLLPHQLNYSLWQTLVILHLNKDCTALDIAKELSISRPAVTKRLNHLTDLGCIQQIPLPDKRQKQLSLSEFGEQLFQECSQEIDDLEVELLKPFDRSELKQSHQFISQLLNSLQHRKEPIHE